jgi:hypothetical protein
MTSEDFGVSISFPALTNTKEEVVVRIFPDELPETHEEEVEGFPSRYYGDLLDGMKVASAPLETFLEVAREYYRQGRDDSFRHVLNFILNSLQESPELQEFYRKRTENYDELIIIMRDALAGDALARARTAPANDKDALMRNCVEHVQLASAQGEGVNSGEF